MSDANLKNYTKAIRALQEAEAAYRASLDAIDTAKTEGNSDKLPRLRMQAQEAERHLSERLTDLETCHRGHFLARRIKLIPEMIRLARLAREYDVFARLAGDTSVRPSKTVIDEEYVKSFSTDGLEQGIPLEEPRCDMLVDERGAWR